MSARPRYDPLGLAELDSRLAPESADSGFEPTLSCGLPMPERVAGSTLRPDRIESRRAFVEMKQLFMRAVENLAHRKAAWLRAQVRAAEDPVDLWLLRGPLLSALREDDLATRAMRAALYRALDHAFPAGLRDAGTHAAPARPRA